MLRKICFVKEKVLTYDNIMNKQETDNKKAQKLRSRHRGLMGYSLIRALSFARYKIIVMATRQ